MDTRKRIAVMETTSEGDCERQPFSLKVARSGLMAVKSGWTRASMRIWVFMDAAWLTSKALDTHWEASINCCKEQTIGQDPLRKGSEDKVTIMS